MAGEVDNRVYSIDHFSTNQNVFEPQRSTHAWIEFDFSNSANSFNITANDLKTGYGVDGITEEDYKASAEVDNFNTLLKLSIDSFSLPQHTVGTITINRANEKIKFAGQIQNGGSGTIQINDWIGADSVRWVQCWDNKCYNIRTGKAGLAKDYKINGTIYQYAPDGTVSRTYKLIGCWIHNVVYGQSVTYGSDSANKVSFTLEYDKGYPIWDEQATTKQETTKQETTKQATT